MQYFLEISFLLDEIDEFGYEKGKEIILVGLQDDYATDSQLLRVSESILAERRGYRILVLQGSYVIKPLCAVRSCNLVMGH